MSKREPKIEKCPFCGEQIVARIDCYDDWFLTCDACQYTAAIGPTKSGVIISHNAVARRLDPARVLMVLGGMKGYVVARANAGRHAEEVEGPLMEIFNAIDLWESAQIAIDDAMNKIRTMAKESSK